MSFIGILGRTIVADGIPLRPDIKIEYDRWMHNVGSMDPYSGKFTIGIHEVLQAHFLLADFFAESGEGIGGIGPKDIGLLHSALSRQFVYFGTKPRWKDRIEVCSTLMYGLIKNHPFFDANKRTAFLISLLHLQKIGRTPTVSHETYEDFTVDVADDTLSKYPTYDDYPALSPDREIMTMAKFLKRNTRDIELQSRIITYNQLVAVLAPRGFRLDHPKGNMIDVMRVVDGDGVTLLVKPRRIGRIGFPGWSKQVGPGDIRRVREMTKLDARFGYDSQSFFNGLDDPLTLIKKYREPLRRLAFR